MPLDNNSAKLVLLFCFILSLSCASPAKQSRETISTDSFTALDDFGTIGSDPFSLLDAFRPMLEATQTNEASVLLERWSEYLQQHLLCSNEEYLQAIKILTLKYSDEIVQTGECEKAAIRARSNHSSQWLDDLIERFGASFVTENRSRILMNTRLEISYKASKCHDNYRRLFFQEAMLYEALRYYIRIFSDFYDGLSQKDKAALELQETFAARMLDGIDAASFAQIFAGMPRAVIYEQRALNADKELYAFLYEYTHADNFDSSAAAYELDAFIRRHKKK